MVQFGFIIVKNSPKCGDTNPIQLSIIVQRNRRLPLHTDCVPTSIDLHMRHFDNLKPCWIRPEVLKLRRLAKKDHIKGYLEVSQDNREYIEELFNGPHCVYMS